MRNGGETINGGVLQKTAVLAVVLITVLMAFWALGLTGLGNHEAYVAVTARGMVDSGDWVVPIFNGEPRLQKTPLNYWLVAGGAKIAGGVNDFVTRLPSAVSAVIVSLAILYFVSDWLGLRAAALSAVIFSTSLCFIRYSHTGRPEMTLAGFVSIAMLSFYSAATATNRKKQIICMLVFWISFSVSMLAKGPAPLPLIFPALFIWFLYSCSWKLVPKLLPLSGTILFLIIFLPWPIAVFLKMPQASQIWHDEFLGRAAGEYAAGSKPLYYYFRVMFAHFVPYSAFIPLALAAPFYKVWAEKRKPLIYLWLWFVVGIVVMTLCGGKRQHYILPLMPAMAIMTGVLLEDMIFINKAYTKKFAAAFLWSHTIIIIAGLIGGMIWLGKSGNYYISLAAVIVASTVIIAVIGLSVLFWLNKKRFATVLMFTLICAVLLSWPFMVSADTDENNVIRDFARSAFITAKGKEIIGYCEINASFVYYFGSNVEVISDVEEIYARYLQGAAIIATGDEFEHLKNDSRFLLVLVGADDGRGLFVKK